MGAALIESAGASGEELPRPQETRRGDVLYRSFGKTGQTVSVLGVGGSHIGEAASDSLATQIIRTAIDRGINFTDNSWDYNNGDGQAETRMGKALRDGYRQKAFLMTKVDGRTKETAAKQLDESLKRLQTDHVDLLQLHEVIRMDPDRFFAPGGALGFTGHMSAEQITALAAKTKQAAMTGKYELFKTTSHFDSTAKNPAWLG